MLKLFFSSPLIKLPSCMHKVCYNCCKTICFSPSSELPKHWREIMGSPPEWPYDDDNNQLELKKYNEYCEYEATHFDMETKSYDELIAIRNELISKRSVWMNVEEFINYENVHFKYHTECVRLEAEWENNGKHKIKENSSCPLCRQDI